MLAVSSMFRGGGHRSSQAPFSLRRSIQPEQRTTGDLKRTSVDRIAVQIQAEHAESFGGSMAQVQLGDERRHVHPVADRIR